MLHVRCQVGQLVIDAERIELNMLMLLIEVDERTDGEDGYS